MPTTPQMSLILPVPTTTLGPEWATELNEALETVDTHDHTAGKGVQIPTAGLNIDDSLALNSNSVTEARSVQLDNQLTPLSGVSEANSVQISGGDLWIVNGSGVAVQVTSGTSVVAPSSSNTPAGIVLPYAGSSAPAGYLMADGTAVNRVTFAVLFGVIGTTFGVGDGSTTFNLPNPAGRTIMGVGTYTDSVSGSITRTLGQQVGAAAHVLVTAEMPSHNHGGGAHTHTYAAYNAPNTPTLGAMTGNSSNVANPSTSNSGTIITTQGSDAAHNNMQPSLGLNYIIKT